MQDIQERYFDALRRAVFNADPEEALAAAADLGRDCLREEIPPEEVTDLHHRALMRLAAENPDLKLIQVVERLLAPLMEVSMAYSLLFRQQLESKYTRLAQQAQSSRLEALGTLAAGIAHDFNTILGVINGYAELLSDEFAEQSRGRENTEQIIAASIRARDLIVRMLAFARDKTIDTVEVDVVALVGDALDAIRVSLPPAVEIEFAAELAQARMLTDPLKIHQLVMNLCVNAADAMDGAGKITLRIRRAPPTGLDHDQPDRRFELVVSDQGCGMSPAVLQRLFDPFYTTKAPGKGSGLGLFVVYGIVADLGGEIAIDSQVGAGSTFTLSLPLSRPAPSADAGDASI